MKYYQINTYGCQMNIHESEKIAGILMSIGYSPVEGDNSADIYVFNTCCIRDNAEKKILGHIGELKRVKEKNHDVIIAIVGCMTQQYMTAEKLTRRFPFIDITLGTSNIDLLSDAIAKVLFNNKEKFSVIDANERPSIIEPKIAAYRTSGCNAWVNIMYGCNNFCTYCVVPLVRGRERSRDADLIIHEVTELLAGGYKEITLLGQNVNSYGSDVPNKCIDFACLLDRLGQIKGKHRIKFMTSHPKDLNEKVIDIISKYPSICNYIHLPIQSGSNRILQLMNRSYTREYYIDLVQKIKQKLPNCGITTDFLVGFPGETEEDFLDTLDLISHIEFSTAFTYIYSPRKGTPAADMVQIPYNIKSERIQRLIKLQNDTTKLISQKYYDKIYEVLCENYKADGMACGRTDFGRLVTFIGRQSLVGSFVNVKIISSQSAALKGQLVE